MKSNIEMIMEGLPEWQLIDNHELCTIFPEMNGEDYDNLVNSMNTHGFLTSDPIVLINITPDAPQKSWQILDGRNRHLAAMKAKVDPLFVEYVGDDSVGFVTSKNLDRRHLSTGQKAAIAAELATLLSGQNSTSTKISQADAAKKTGIGEATIRRFNFIKKHDPELAERVKSGDLPLEQARAKVKEKVKAETEAKEIEKEDKVEAEAIPEPKTSGYGLGDKRALRRAKEIEILKVKMNEEMIDLMANFQVKGDKYERLIIAAMQVGYTICKGE